MLPKKDLMSQPGTDDEISASQGRLQRDSLHGARITTFRQVLLRHGLFLVLLATLCAFLPNAVADLSWSTRGLFASPQSYALAFLGLLGCFGPFGP